MEGPSHSPHSPRALPLAVFAIVLVARLAFLWAYQSSAFSDWHAWRDTDEHGFLEWSEHLAAGNWLDVPAWRAYVGWQFSTGTEEQWRQRFEANAYFQGPLYPYTLALLRLVFGSPIVPARLLQALLAAMAAGVVAWAASDTVLRALPAARRPALLAGVVAGGSYGFYGPLVMHDLILYRDGPVAHLSAFLLAIPLLTHRRGWTAFQLGAFGFLGGLAILLKQTIAPVALLAAWCAARRAPLSLRRALVAGGLGLAIPIGALAARNVAVGVPPLTFDTRQAMCLIWGTARGADASAAPSPLLIPILDAANGSTLKAITLTLASYRDDPSALAILMAKKVATFFHAYEIPDNLSFDFFRDRLPGMRWLPVFACLLGPGLVGLLAAWRVGWIDLHETMLLAMGILAPLASCLLVSMQSRYRVAALAPLALGASWGAAWLAANAAAPGGAWRGVAGIVAAALVSGVALLPPVIDAPAHRFADTRIYASLLEHRGRTDEAVREIHRYVAEGTDDPARQLGVVAVQRWLEGDRPSRLETWAVSPPEERYRAGK